MKGSSFAGKEFAQQVFREAEQVLGSAVQLSPAEQEQEAVFEAVLRTEELGWVKHDLAAYLAGFTDDARALDGRTEEPGPRDVVLDRRRLEAVRRLQFQGPQGEVTSAVEDVKTQVDGDRATLQCRSVGQREGGYFVFGARYRLRRTAGGWKITESRGCLLEWKSGSQRSRMDAAALKRLDDRVEEVRGQGDRRELARALDEANRPAEAYAVAREVTERPGPQADDWKVRGDLALKTGEAEDAVASYRKALIENPEIETPPCMSRERHALREHKGPVFGADFAPDGRHVVSGGDDALVKVWDADTGKEVRTFKGHEARISGVAWSPDGKRIAAGGHDRTVRVWDALTGDEVAVLRGHTGTVYRVAWDPTSRRVVSASADRSLRVWDVDSRQAFLTIADQPGDIMGAVFSPDGRRLATAGADGPARIWDVETGRQLLLLPEHTGGTWRVAYRPDGKWLATVGADGLVRLCDAENGKELRTMAKHAGLVETVTFSADGRYLASAGRDCLIRVWEAATGREVIALRGHAGQVIAVAFSRDGKRLVSAAGDGTVRIWDVTPPEEWRR
jgi:Tol biopolymer transport system component